MASKPSWLRKEGYDQNAGGSRSLSQPIPLPFFPQLLPSKRAGRSCRKHKRRGKTRAEGQRMGHRPALGCDNWGPGAAGREAPIGTDRGLLVLGILSIAQQSTEPQKERSIAGQHGSAPPNERSEWCRGGPERPARIVHFAARLAWCAGSGHDGNRRQPPAGAMPQWARWLPERWVRRGGRTKRSVEPFL